MNPEITIRPAASTDDYQACQDVQRDAWGLADESYVVPIATMVGAQLHGGLVLGAFLPDGQAVGVSFAFLGRLDGRICLYSQLTGIRPGYQDQGLGTRLKLAQRDFAIGQGVDLIAWAFDPLQGGNARFNLEKLGATARHYIVDMYGTRTDALNVGTPTDRLIAAWETNPRPRPPLDSTRLDQTVALIDAEDAPDGSRIVRKVRQPDGSPRLLLEIPTDIARLRANDPERASAWQGAVRKAFLDAFEAGYQAVGFVRASKAGAARAAYVLVCPD